MPRGDIQAQAVWVPTATGGIPGRDSFVRLEIDGNGAIFVFQVRIEPTAFGVHRVTFGVARIRKLRLLRQRGPVQDPNALFAWSGDPHLSGRCDIGNTVWPGVEALTRHAREGPSVER